MTFQTYVPASQEDADVETEVWNEFRKRMDELEGPIKAITDSRNIDEKPPSMDGNEFRPGGWVGEYDPGLLVVPDEDRVTDAGYERMLSTTQGWIETLGPLSAEALAFAPDVLLDAQTLYGSYSRQLIEFTEQLLASRTPVTVERQQTRGQTLVGRPVFSAIQQERANRTGQLVSETVTFQFDNLQNRLLTRFHAELLQQVRWVREQLGPAGVELDTLLGYHREFLEAGLPVDLINEALQTNFDAPRTMARLRNNASPQMTQIIDLWEAYRREQTRELDPSDRFSSCVKPLSKVYELWLLALLVKYLETATDSTAVVVSDTLSEIRIGDIRIYHDTSKSRHSKYITPFLRPGKGIEAGKPDLLIAVDGTVRWVGEAKCRPWQNIRKEDAMRFLAYIVDYLPKENPGAAALIGPNDPDQTSKMGPAREQSIENYSTVRNAVIPSEHEQLPEWLENQLVETGIIDSRVSAVI